MTWRGLTDRFSVVSQEQERTSSLHRRCFTCRSRGERGDCRDPFEVPEEPEGAERRESVNRAASQVREIFCIVMRKIFLIS